jgi:hypothetical protein
MIDIRIEEFNRQFGQRNEFCIRNGIDRNVKLMRELPEVIHKF